MICSPIVSTGLSEFAVDGVGDHVLGPAHLAQWFGRKREQVGALEFDHAGGSNPTGGCGDEPQQGKRGDGLATPRLTNEAEGLAWP